MRTRNHACHRSFASILRADLPGTVDGTNAPMWQDLTALTISLYSPVIFGLQNLELSDFEAQFDLTG